jgi:hypothetical protein
MQSASSHTLDARRLEKVKNHPGIYKRGNRYVAIVRDPDGNQRKRAARTIKEAESIKARTRTRGGQQGATRSVSDGLNEQDPKRRFPSISGEKPGTARPPEAGKQICNP